MMTYVINMSATGWDLINISDSEMEFFEPNRLYHSCPDHNPYIEVIDGVYHYKGRSLALGEPDNVVQITEYMGYVRLVEKILGAVLVPADVKRAMDCPTIKAHHEIGSTALQAAASAEHWADLEQSVKYI